MLARERLDIIGVVTSDHRHADIVVDAATSGVKGVMCEKPLATSLEDADRMIRACAERGGPDARQPHPAVEPSDAQGP